MLTRDDKLFVALWFPVAFAVAWAIPPMPRWPTAVVWFLIGAMTWHCVVKAVQPRIYQSERD